MMEGIKYFEVSLDSVIRFYIQNALKYERDWELVGIDSSRDVVMFKRYEFGKKVTV